MTANRVVASLTPLAAVLAGASADWLAKHAPGVEVPPAALEEVFIGGIAAVVAPALVWMLGWQKYEAREAAAAAAADQAAALHLSPPAADPLIDPAELELGDELEGDGLLEEDVDLDDEAALEEDELEDEDVLVGLSAAGPAS